MPRFFSPAPIEMRRGDAKHLLSGRNDSRGEENAGHFDELRGFGRCTEWNDEVIRFSGWSHDLKGRPAGIKHARLTPK